MEPALSRYPDEALKDVLPSSKWGIWLGKLTRLLNLAYQENGTAVFLGAGTVNVSFVIAQKDASYALTLGSHANETMWVTGKSAVGFTLNSSNIASVATCDWGVHRN